MDIYIYNLLNFLLAILFILGFVTVVMWFKKKEGERKTNLMMSALEKGQTLDPELFRSCKPSKVVNHYILLALLVAGSSVTLFASIALFLGIIHGIATGNMDDGDIMPCVLLLSIGVSLLLGYFKGKKMLKD